MLLRVWRENLLLRVAAVTSVSVVLVGAVLVWWYSREMHQNILEHAAHETADIVLPKVQGILTPGDFRGPITGDKYEELDKFLWREFPSLRIARVKLWNPQGMVVYSTLREHIGRTHPISPELSRALQGEVAWTLTKGEEEDIRERQMGRFVEVYIPVIFPYSSEVAGVLEVYQYYEPYGMVFSRLERDLLILVAIAFLTMPISLYFIVRTGWRAILWQRELAHRRAEEAENLNRLLQRQLEHYFALCEGIRDLKRELERYSTADDPAARDAAQAGLALKIGELAREVEARWWTEARGAEEGTTPRGS